MYKPYSWPTRILQSLAWSPTRLLFNVFCHFEVRGREHLKGIEQAIFAVNHSSELDPIIITAALNPLGRFAPLFYIAGPSERFRDSSFGWRRHLYSSKWFFRAWGAYPHISGHKNYEYSLQHHKQILDDGGSVVIFPEGFITKSGELGEPRGGVIYLSHATSVPIVPVAISGVYKMNAKGFLSRKRTMILEFGKPVMATHLLPKDVSIDPAEHYKPAATKVFERLSRLLERHKNITYRIPRHIQWSYACIRLFLGPIVRTLWIKRVDGIKNIPRKGSVLIAATHESYFDFICTIAVAHRNVYYLAAEKFFRNPLWRPLMRITGQVEVDREHKENRTHIDKVVYDLLNAGHAVGIFPEGTRAPTSTELLRGFPGVIRYATTTGAPICPIGIRGTFDVMSRFDKKPKILKIVELNVGPLIRYDNDDIFEPSDERIKQELTLLMRNLAILSGKSYPYEQE